MNMKDIDELIKLLKECIDEESEDIKFSKGGELKFDDYWLARKVCVGRACGKWVRRFRRITRAKVGKCVEALYDFLDHGNKNVLLKQLEMYFGE